jgi:hypothetical protein
VKNVHPLRAARRKEQRVVNPPELRCIFCLELEHVAAHNHDFLLTFPDICQKHHDQITEARRDADISMAFERDRVKRVALALKSVSVFLHKLADAMWRWAELLLDESKEDR